MALAPLLGLLARPPATYPGYEGGTCLATSLCLTTPNRTTGVALWELSLGEYAPPVPTPAPGAAMTMAPGPSGR